MEQMRSKVIEDEVSFYVAETPLPDGHYLYVAVNNESYEVFEAFLCNRSYIDDPEPYDLDNAGYASFDSQKIWDAVEKGDISGVEPESYDEENKDFYLKYPEELMAGVRATLGVMKEQEAGIFDSFNKDYDPEDEIEDEEL